jgi:hypothetical protein
MEFVEATMNKLAGEDEIAPIPGKYQRTCSDA